MNSNDYIAGYSFDEWETLKKRFEQDFLNSKKYNKSFGELIKDIVGDDTSTVFSDKTELSENMLSRLKNRVDAANPSQKNTIISICIGYDLDLMMALALFHSQGSDLNRFKKEDYAYSFILTQCRGKDISECNEILRELGVSDGYLLGAYARKPRKSNK